MFFWRDRQQIRKIRAVLEEIEKGDIRPRINIYSKNSLGHLAQSIDKAISALARQISGLKKRPFRPRPSYPGCRKGHCHKRG